MTFTPHLDHTSSTATVQQLFSLSGQVAFVTGSTRGIGQACAIALAQAGADVILAQRPSATSAPETTTTTTTTTAAAAGVSPQQTLPPPSSSHNTTTRDIIVSLGRQCDIIDCDLADLTSDGSASVKTAWQRAQQDILHTKWNRPHHSISILVNCAGIQRRHSAITFPESEWDEVLDVNLKSAFLLAQSAAPSMIQNGYGKIINFASLLTFQGGFTVTAYASAKSGIAGLTRALSNEWASQNVTVNAIAPGYVATDMNERLRADPTRLREISERIPAGRWGSPDDFKGVVVWLASRASQYVTGEIVTVDGGWMGR